ncbi:MAG: division/cell wall cluster transcriptional repressor MraZ [Saprospiraceae bacterium]|nr:division/cell wall cluster transcriptional repressor MraZ [Saprospiraceae bacterium]HRG32228.1 division/cell wall cluster transcriptional repressor MraZ [Saprospiraceae bacterium]
MYKLSGEYEIKLDDKSRLRLPSALMRLLEVSDRKGLVINRGFEKCLILYPQEVWEEKTKEVNQLNPYNIKNREFARYFYRGATQLEPDAASRIVLPKTLMEHAGIQTEVMLLAFNDQIEIWSRNEYLKMVDNEPENFAELAQEVFRHKDV